MKNNPIERGSWAPSHSNGAPSSCYDRTCCVKEWNNINTRLIVEQGSNDGFRCLEPYSSHHVVLAIRAKHLNNHFIFKNKCGGCKEAVKRANDLNGIFSMVLRGDGFAIVYQIHHDKANGHGHITDDYHFDHFAPMACQVPEMFAINSSWINNIFCIFNDRCSF